MCMICDHYNAERLTAEEAFKNLDELIRSEVVDEEHAQYVLALVLNKEMEIVEAELEFRLDDLFV